MNNQLKSIFYFLFFLFYLNINADSFEYNIYNNHGVVGLINTPTARFYNESTHGVTLYNGTPDQKVTLSSNPFNWLEASFFYTNIQGFPYPGFEYQDYKDKGFNVKFRIKEQGLLPAVAIGINDIAGTGYYSSEYLVGSYGINNYDIHFGLGWGTLNDESSSSKKNPLIILDNSFEFRPKQTKGAGGQFDLNRYFSGKTAAPFYGISYALNNKTLIKFERDTTSYKSRIDYDIPKSKYSFGIDYSFNDNFTLGLSYERGNFASVKFVYKNNPKASYKKYQYQSAEIKDNQNKYDKLINNLEKNGIGVNKIVESTNSIGLELTQFTHPNLQIIEEIIYQSSKDAGIQKNIKKNLKVANLNAVSEYEKDFEDNGNVIYKRSSKSGINSSTGIKFRPFLASREEFFKGALLVENDTEIIIKDDFLFNFNLKYSLANNFDDLRFPPVDTFPAQVRSDVKEYLKNMDDRLMLGRAQFDYFKTPYRDHHIMLSAGIFEDMFSGYGAEYLYHKYDTNYSFGFEIFNIKKRDYNWRFGTLDYQNTTGHFNFYYRNYGLIPFDMKISYGEYLAGDIGSTIQLSRSFINGVQFGVFASNTNVTKEQFGEGTFDKGLFFNIPIYGNLINYTWRPLTKDPGAKLIRRNNLHDLLVKFRPIN
jgi:hypothetical protein